MPTLNTTAGAFIDYTPTIVQGSLPITFSLSGAPSWLSINSLSGRITGTVPATQAAGHINFDIVAKNCFADGQAGNEYRLPMVLVVGTNCQPVAIYDSGTASCVPLQITSTTFTNTIVKGQATTSFTIRAEGDDSPGFPLVLWTNAAGATLTKIPGTARDYKLDIASGQLEDGTYDYTVYGRNCRAASSDMTPTTERRFTLVVGTGVGGPQTGGGGGSCTATINAPGSHPVDRILNYQLTLTSGGNCRAWQTWFLHPGQTGGATGDGAVIGQRDSEGIGAGTYQKNVSALPQGNYVLWAKCNDGSSCQNAWVTKPITLTAPGTEPTIGGSGVDCKKPSLVPVSPNTMTLYPAQVASFEVQLTTDSPVQGVSVTAVGTNKTGPVSHIFTSVSWIEGRRYRVTVAMNPNNNSATDTVTIKASNSCGESAATTVTVTRTNHPDLDPLSCTPVALTAPPASTITEITQLMSTSFSVTGTGPIDIYSSTHPNVWFSRNGNTVTADGQFGFGDHSIVINAINCGNKTASVVWRINKSG